MFKDQLHQCITINQAQIVFGASELDCLTCESAQSDEQPELRLSDFSIKLGDDRVADTPNRTFHLNFNDGWLKAEFIPVCHYVNDTAFSRRRVALIFKPRALVSDN